MHLASCGLSLSVSDDFRIPKPKYYYCNAGRVDHMQSFPGTKQTYSLHSSLKDNRISSLCDASTDHLDCSIPVLSFDSSIFLPLSPP